MLQHQAPDDGASAEDEGERADEDDDDVEEEAEGVVTCETGGGFFLTRGDSHPEAPSAPTPTPPRSFCHPLGTDATFCHGLAAPTSSEDAGIFALLDVSPVVEVNFHPAAVRLVVERDLRRKGGTVTSRKKIIGWQLLACPATHLYPVPTRVRGHPEVESDANALTVMVKV